MCPVTTRASLGHSTRWCPTADQVMLLEEMYKGGLRNPSTSQIHQITAHLLHYGKVQGKNVFYWFQNHKARDKQRVKNKLIRQSSCYYANLSEQGPASWISSTRPLIITRQPGPETFEAISCKLIQPKDFGGMKDNTLTWSGMYRRHDHPNTPTSMLGQEGLVTSFQSLISQSGWRRRTLDLFPVTPANIKNREEPCFDDIHDAGSIEFDSKPVLSLYIPEK